MGCTDDPRYQFIVDVMLDNVRAVLGESKLFVKHGNYPYPAPPALQGVTPDLYAEGAGVSIAADAALGEDVEEELARQTRLVRWAAEVPGRHYWVGIPLSYELTSQQKQWQEEGRITLHPLQI